MNAGTNSSHRQSRTSRAALALLLALGTNFLLAGCMSPFSRLETLREGNNVALYALNADEYPKDSDEIKKDILPITKMPQISNEKLKEILGNLKYHRKTIWGVQERRVFYRQELNIIVPQISEAISKLKENQRLVIISRFDPDVSVLSRMERVTALLWADKTGVNLVLGEIRNEIPHNDFLEFETWTEIMPISLRRSYPFYALAPSEDYELKKILGFTHDTWAVFKHEKLAAIQYRPETKSFSADQKRQLLIQARDMRVITRKEYDEKLRQLNLDEKRRILKESLDAKLLTPEEYQIKLKQLENPPEKKQPKDEKPAEDPEDPKDVPP